MIEAEWLALTDPTPMLKFLCRRDALTARKQRLFAVGCCRRIWHILTDERSRAAVEVTERLADGLASHEERRATVRAALDATEDMRTAGESYYYAASAADDLVTGENLGLFDSWCEAALTGKPGQSEEPYQALLVRDVFGNPFHPVAIKPSWLTSDVRTLAEGIYNDRAFDRMPILADALQDAGCDNDDVLSHCRGGGPHVRGCWVVDLVLGKS